MNQTIKALVASLVVVIAVCGVVMYGESIDVVDAATASDSVIVTLNVATGITITSPSDTVMSNTLGVSVNHAVATTTWNVKTNNAVGYSLTVLASTNPAMQSGGNTIADYSTTTMPSTWSVSSGNAKFGFSATGTDVNTTTWGTGKNCQTATDTPATDLKYYGFYTNATTTSTRATPTSTSGVDTTICYAVEQNGTYISSGVYTATITATATTL